MADYIYWMYNHLDMFVEYDKKRELKYAKQM